MPSTKSSSCCPDCGARPGQRHKPGCDIELCTVCGEQRLGCRCRGHDPSAAGWTGAWPTRPRRTGRRNPRSGHVQTSHLSAFLAADLARSDAYLDEALPGENIESVMLPTANPDLYLAFTPVISPGHSGGFAPGMFILRLVDGGGYAVDLGVFNYTPIPMGK